MGVEHPKYQSCHFIQGLNYIGFQNSAEKEWSLKYTNYKRFL